MTHGSNSHLIKTIDDIGDNVWNEFAASQAHSTLYHSSHWRKVFQKAYGLKSYYLVKLDSKNKVEGLLPIVHQKSRLFGNHLGSLPFFVNYAGVLAKNSDAANALYAYAGDLARKLGAHTLQLRGTEVLDIEWPCQQHKICMHLKLPSTADELWKAIGSKRRSQIKRPEREGIEIVHGGRELLKDFYSVMTRNMRDLGSPVHSKAFYSAILETFPQQTHIILIKKSGIAVAGGFLIGYKHMLEIPWASSLREYNSIGVNMRLYWEVLKYAIEQGYEVFDFGRSSKDSNTYRFKKQWGAQPVQCYWYTWGKHNTEHAKPSTDNAKFQLAINVWRRMPLPVANVLGPMLVRHLP